MLTQKGYDGWGARSNEKSGGAKQPRTRLLDRRRFTAKKSQHNYKFKSPTQANSGIEWATRQLNAIHRESHPRSDPDRKLLEH